MVLQPSSPSGANQPALLHDGISQPSAPLHGRHRELDQTRRPASGGRVQAAPHLGYRPNMAKHHQDHPIIPRDRDGKGNKSRGDSERGMRKAAGELADMGGFNGPVETSSTCLATKGACLISSTCRHESSVSPFEHQVRDTPRVPWSHGEERVPSDGHTESTPHSD
jgi:hypothetical protein